MEEKVVELKKALAAAIVDTHRVKMRYVNVDEAAGSTCEVDWLDNVKLWARLCDLDFGTVDPCWYFPGR